MKGAYQVQLDFFEGPLDLLLQLIEGAKLDITEISLAAVTDQYLTFIEKREGVELRDLSQFLSVAAKLLLIKSKALLPMLSFTEEEEEDIEELKYQLALYARYKKAAKALRQQLGKEQPITTRPTYIGGHIGYVAPRSVRVQTLYQNCLTFLDKQEIAETLPEETLKKIISLEERIQEMRSLLLKTESALFHDLHNDSKDEKIVSFLAVLELVKQKLIAVRQEALFQEIHIMKR